MSRTLQKHVWNSPVVRSFWESVGGRCPEDAVRRICDQMTGGLRRNEPPFQSDRYEYAELLGVRVIEKEISDRKLQGVLSTCGNEFLILINKNDSPERKSFTVCHEVGHIQMLKAAESTLGRDRVLKHVAGSREEEFLSDAFAINLLMPRQDFKRAARDLDMSMTSLSELAKRYRTSIEAAARRVVGLNVWPCSVLWGSLEKLCGGSFAVKISNHIHSASLATPPLSNERHVRWCVDAVWKAYDNRRLTRSPVTFRHPGQQTVEKWWFECVHRTDHRGESFLALMFRQ